MRIRMCIIYIAICSVCCVCVCICRYISAARPDPYGSSLAVAAAQRLLNRSYSFFLSFAIKFSFSSILFFYFIFFCAGGTISVSLMCKHLLPFQVFISYERNHQQPFFQQTQIHPPFVCILYFQSFHSSSGDFFFIRFSYFPPLKNNNSLYPLEFFAFPFMRCFCLQQFRSLHIGKMTILLRI